ncbi:WD repeat-containing protein 46 [Nothoprocta perdicaria]|uniref:WD repeat-containing protein 46 n=1 Tax=Nothoprocta perdicaria TaxID=30464 RepID=UPI000E1B767F|nr:WD repeat-containing protein 46 [Nothoprocta perdicaria]
MAEAAATRAARLELLLPQEPGFLEADPGEDTCTVTQGDIAAAVDIASAAKHFELRLEQFGPYRLDYTRPGRHLLLGGRRGHVAALDWLTKSLMCEINVMETVTDVARDLSRKPYLCHRLPQPAHGLRFCPYEDVLGAGHGGGFTSLLVPGAGEANFDALESNPYRSRKQRQEWEVKALLEKIPAELITLDPTHLERVDTASLEQKRRERVERLGFDPDAQRRFRPRRKAKGGSSAGGLLRRKRKVAHDKQRAVIRRSVEQREQRDKDKDKAAAPARRSALDRFKK